MTAALKKYLISAAISLLFGLLLVFPPGKAPGRLASMPVDSLFERRGPVKVPADIVILGIDQESYSKMNVSMHELWPRKYQVEALKFLATAGARGAVFDFGFSGQSQDPAVDSALEEALTLLPTVIADDSRAKVYQSAGGEKVRRESFSPAPGFWAAVTSVAKVQLPQDPDGVMRRFLITKPDDPVPTLAEAGAMLAGELSGKPGPVDLINFYGPMGTIPLVPVWKILTADRGQLLSEFKDKVVFIGNVLSFDQTGARRDSFVTPFNGKGETFGVEIHATAALNLINKDWIKTVDGRSTRIWIALALAAVLFLCCQMRPLAGALTSVIIVVLVGVVWLELFSRGTYLPLAPAMACLLCGALGVNPIFNYLLLRRAGKKIESALKGYVSKEVAREIIANESVKQLSPVRKEMTVIFTDLEGFTPFVEATEPEVVSSLLNSYMTEITSIVHAHGGTILNFLGDSVYAVWGAPLVCSDGPDRAVCAAREIDRKMSGFVTPKSNSRLNTRIGIHHGLATAGNFGSADRFWYTAIGDSINTASRLEGANKHLGTSVLLSHDVRRLMKNRENLLFLGRFLLEGKKTATKLYTVCNTRPEAETRRQWLSALRDFRKARWEKARDEFANLESNPLIPTKTVLLYLGAIEKMTIPAKGWRGEIRLHK